MVYRKEIRKEILKYISLEDLEKEIQTKKIEFEGLFSTEACEFILAKEMGLIKEKMNFEKPDLKKEIQTNLSNF